MPGPPGGPTKNSRRAASTPLYFLAHSGFRSLSRELFRPRSEATIFLLLWLDAPGAFRGDAALIRIHVQCRHGGRSELPPLLRAGFFKPVEICSD